MSTTRAVNVKAEFIRPRHQNLREWMKDPNNVFVGRNGRIFIDKAIFCYPGSMWANPFKISKTMSRKTAVEKYEVYIRNKIEQEGLQKDLLALKGKALGCWCKPEACHSDVLVKLVEEYSQRNSEAVVRVLPLPNWYRAARKIWYRAARKIFNVRNLEAEPMKQQQIRLSPLTNDLTTKHNSSSKTARESGTVQANRRHRSKRNRA